MIDWLLFNANSNIISAIWQSYSLIDWLVVNANISSISAVYWREQFFFYYASTIVVWDFEKLW
jgi:hypothetical protein